MEADAVLLDEGDEIGRGVAREGGFGEVGVGGEEVIGRAANFVLHVGAMMKSAGVPAGAGAMVAA